ncbi:MAG: chorismate mutase, partial [Candidatus Peribacteraceae bacterium]|nr:chorismate mutase [Candidatus Peribacteraceae bacterium]
MPSACPCTDCSKKPHKQARRAFLLSKYHTYTPRTSVNCKVLEYGEYIAPVASVLDLRRQVDAIDRQTVELLSRRNALVKQITSQLDEDEPDKAREAQVLSNWL